MSGSAMQRSGGGAATSVGGRGCIPKERMCIHIYIYTHMYTCMHIYIYIQRERQIYTYIHMHSKGTCVSMCTPFYRSRLHVHSMYKPALSSIVVHLCVHLYITSVCTLLYYQAIYIYIYMYIYTHLHIYIYIYIYTHMCIRTLLGWQRTSRTLRTPSPQ